MIPDRRFALIQSARASNIRNTIQVRSARLQYSAILLDLRMPGMDGYGVLETLRTTLPDVLPRVLVLTAALTQRDMQRVKTFRVCGVIAKPFEVETLLSAVRHCVDPGNNAPLVNHFFPAGVILLLADLLRQVPAPH